MSWHNSFTSETLGRFDQVFAAAQAHGWIGTGSSASILDVSRQFVDLVATFEWSKAIELGSGGGIPGLVVAMAFPAVRLTCIESDLRRVDHLWWAVHLLNLENRVSVIHGRAEGVAHTPEHRGQYDLCLARSFAPLPVTVEIASGFLCTGGRCVVSQPSRLSTGLARAAALDNLGLVECVASTSMFVGIQREPCPSRYPRTEKLSRRDPLWNVSRET